MVSPGTLSSWEIKRQGIVGVRRTVWMEQQKVADKTTAPENEGQPNKQQWASRRPAANGPQNHRTQTNSRQANSRNIPASLSPTPPSSNKGKPSRLRPTTPNSPSVMSSMSPSRSATSLGTSASSQGDAVQGNSSDSATAQPACPSVMKTSEDNPSIQGNAGKKSKDENSKSTSTKIVQVLLIETAEGNGRKTITPLSCLLYFAVHFTDNQELYPKEK